MLSISKRLSCQHVTCIKIIIETVHFLFFHTKPSNRLYVFTYRLVTFGLVTCQVFNSHMWPVAMILEGVARLQNLLTVLAHEGKGYLYFIKRKIWSPFNFPPDPHPRSHPPPRYRPAKRSLSPHTGLVSERPGQVQAQPLTAGKHGRGQGHGGGAADRDAVRASLGALQRLAQPLQHAHHPHGLD